MPVDPALFKQLVDEAPTKAPNPLPADASSSPKAPNAPKTGPTPMEKSSRTAKMAPSFALSPQTATPMTAGPFFMYSAKKAWLEGQDQWTEAAMGSMAGEGPFATLRLILPREWVDKISPLAIMDKARQADEQALSKLITGDSKREFQPSYLPKPRQNAGDPNKITQSKVEPTPFARFVAGPLGGAVGDPMTLASAPMMGGMGILKNTAGAAVKEIGGTLFKSFLTSAGGREGSELGGEAGKKLGGETGEAIGSIAGGAVGGNLNVARGEATWHAAAKASSLPKHLLVDPFKAFSKAMEDRKEAQLTGQKFSLWESFSDNYRDLKDSAQSYAKRRIVGQIADTLSGNIDTGRQQAAFNASVKRLGLSREDEAAFSIADVTKNPTLLAMQREHHPLDTESAIKQAELQQKKQGVVAKAYKAITGDDPATSKGSIMRSFSDATKTAVARLRGRIGDEIKIRDEVQALSPEGKQGVGSAIDGLFENERTNVQKQFEEAYGKWLAKSDAQGAIYDPSKIGKEAKSLVESIANQAIQANVPAPIRKLADMFGKPTEDRYTGGGFTKPIVKENVEPTMVSARDIHELVSGENGLRAVAHKQYMSGDKIAGDNTRMIYQKLIGLLEESPEMGAEYKAISGAYREQYAKRFKEGVQANLTRETGPNSVRPNSEKIALENIPAKFFRNSYGASAMDDFDKVFGGTMPGTKKVPEAYQALGAYVEGFYKEKVLGLAPGDKDAGFRPFSPEQHAKFMLDNDPAIKRIPGLSEKLEGLGSRVYKSQKEQNKESDRLKNILGSTIFQSVPKEQANALFAAALADPRKMGQLVSMMGTTENKVGLVRDIMLQANPFQNGEYDAKVLMELAKAGSTRPGEVSGMETLFRATYGREKGIRMMQEMKDVAAIAHAEQAGRPKSLTPVNPMSTDPVKEMSGQAPASWAAIIKSQWEGRASGTYTATIAATRFVGVRLRQALEKAEQQALYDPEMMHSIWELYNTPSNVPISHEAITRALGSLGTEGQKIINDMLNKGYITPTMARGALIGAQTYENHKAEERLRKKREQLNP